MPMGFRTLGAVGDRAVIGELKMLLFQRSDWLGRRICRRRGDTVSGDAAHGNPPASRRTVCGQWCWPRTLGDPYAAPSRVCTVADTFRNNDGRWLWVPACAGTTPRDDGAAPRPACV